MREFIKPEIKIIRLNPEAEDIIIASGPNETEIDPQLP